MQQFALEDHNQSSPQNNCQEIGKVFMQARQERRIDLAEAAQSLHIRQVYLEAIEQGNFDILPGHVYTLGFMKKYAEFLNLDYYELQRRLDLRNNTYTTIVVEDIMQPYTMSSYKKPIWLSLTLVMLGGGGYTYFCMYSATKPEVDLISESPPIIEHAKTDQLTSNQQENQQIEPKTISELPPAEDLPIATVVEPVAKAPSLILYAKESTWIDLRDAAGQPLFSRILKKGEAYTLPPQKGLVMAVGNAGGLEMRKDDVILPLLGGAGQVRKGLSVDQLFSLDD